jgi:hypothetical protein
VALIVKSAMKRAAAAIAAGAVVLIAVGWVVQVRETRRRLLDALAKVPPW